MPLGFYLFVLAVLVLAAIEAARPAKLAVLVKRGKVVSMECFPERIHHSGEHIPAYYSLWRTRINFEDGEGVLVERHGTFTWRVGTMLTITRYNGVQEFSPPPRHVDYSPAQSLPEFAADAIRDEILA